jgi:hypothetical protein
MSKERLRTFAQGGPSIIVGSVDESGQPAACRAVGLRSNDDFDTFTVYLPVATSRDMVNNVAMTQRIAVAMTHPLSHSAIQMKGTTLGVRLSSPDEEKLIEKQLGDFAQVLDQIGIPARVTNAFAHWPAFAIDVKIDEVFEQSPGPKAGVPLR